MIMLGGAAARPMAEEQLKMITTSATRNNGTFIIFLIAILSNKTGSLNKVWRKRRAAFFAQIR
jgi:hypothetical protein